MVTASTAANDYKNCHSDGLSFSLCMNIRDLLWMRQANERRRYNVTSSLIGWAHSQNEPWKISHYLTQCWLIVNWTLGNKLQWNSNWNRKLFIQENAFENVVYVMVTILSMRDDLRSDTVGKGGCFSPQYLHIDISYLAPTGEIWDVYRKYFEENCPYHNGTKLHRMALSDKTIP